MSEAPDPSAGASLPYHREVRIMGYLTESHEPHDDLREVAAQVPEYRAAAALNLAADELRRAMGKFGPFAGPHEGYAVLLEEVDELWHEVKHGTRERMREEAVQVAAMALRFLVDVQEEVDDAAQG